MAKIIHSAEEAEKKFNTLPEEVKKLLYSDEMFNIIKQVGEKNQLHIDQIGSLETETGQVMLGFSDTQDYVAGLMETLQVDRTKADAIAQDINDMLFSKIREAMKKVYEENKEEKPSAPQNPPAAEKSVVMPSAAVPPPVPTPKPAAPLPTISSTPAVSATPAKPAPVPPASTPPIAPMHTADVMLSETTVSMPPKKVEVPTPKVEVPPSTNSTGSSQAGSGQVKPGPYKADPYREPPE